MPATLHMDLLLTSAMETVNAVPWRLSLEATMGRAAGATVADEELSTAKRCTRESALRLHRPDVGVRPAG